MDYLENVNKNKELAIAMGVTSFIAGICAGFYFRNTQYGSYIGNKFFAFYKILSDNLSPNYKLVLVVRDDLNMGRGKIASQCSHASVIAYKLGILNNPDTVHLWEAFGQPKVVLKANNEQNILKLYEEAKQLGLNASIISDAGKTQVTTGTKTVLAVGPGPTEMVDKITGHLKLL